MLPDLQQLAITELHQHGWLQHIDWFVEVDSTNSRAKVAADTGIGFPALFVADRQTAGRGRGKNRWWSPSGCLMLTLAIDRNSMPADPVQQSVLGLVCGQAVAKALDAWIAGPLQLKWPNDVYYRGKKIAGILVESHRSGSLLHWLIGIGVNVNIDWSDAPDEVRSKGVCLASAGNGPESIASKHGSPNHLTPAMVLPGLVEQIQQTLETWCDDADAWYSDWLDRCLLSGKVVHVSSGGNEYVGRCEGINRSGHLLLRNNHEVHEINSGEVAGWQ